MNPEVRQLLGHLDFESGFVREPRFDDIEVAIVGAGFGGLLAGGVEYPVDCLIFATGFDLASSFTWRNDYEVIGCDGVSLSDKWSDGLPDVPRPAIRRLPELLFLGSTQTGATTNVPTPSVSSPATWPSSSSSAASAEPPGSRRRRRPRRPRSPRCETRPASSRFYAECTPGYYNSEGAPGNTNGFFASSYGDGPDRLLEILASARATGPPGIEFR